MATNSDYSVNDSIGYPLLEYLYFKRASAVLNFQNMVFACGTGTEKDHLGFWRTENV